MVSLSLLKLIGEFQEAKYPKDWERMSEFWNLSYRRKKSIEERLRVAWGYTSLFPLNIIRNYMEANSFYSIVSEQRYSQQLNFKGRINKMYKATYRYDDRIEEKD